jgi:ParB family chromosome partitioning protein
MIESIKINGVLNPVIVRKTDSGRYQMLAGHNRMNASAHAGLDMVPAIVKEELSDEDAYIYVLETNLMQRSFNDMYPSEKAIVLQLRYDKISSQGRRSDIVKELQVLENGEVTLVEESGTDSRGRLAKEYGLSGRSMARLLRLNYLIEDWKCLVDNNSVALMVGVELSYLNQELQGYIFNDCMEMSIKLSLKDAKTLKALNDENKLTESAISKFFINQEKSKVKKRNYQNIKLSTEVIDKYFDESTKSKEVQSVIEKALEQYFEKRGEAV